MGGQKGFRQPVKEIDLLHVSCDMDVSEDKTITMLNSLIFSKCKSVCVCVCVCVCLNTCISVVNGFILIEPSLSYYNKCFFHKYPTGGEGFCLSSFRTMSEDLVLSIDFRKESRPRFRPKTQDIWEHLYIFSLFSPVLHLRTPNSLNCADVSLNYIHPSICTASPIGRLRGLIGSALDHRSLPAEFESRRGHICKVFHLSLRLITFGGRSAHLAYQVHKSGH